MHKIIDAHAHLGYWPTLAKAKEMLIYSTNKNFITKNNKKKNLCSFFLHI